ncbi:MAG: DegV family protein [Christensenellaceae bacterium]|nr:DegV family protein [Christensenellaceae bacterium]
MVRISADSTCDLTQALINENNITIAPLGIAAGDKLFSDGVDITPADLFRMTEEQGILCQTAAVNTYDYVQLFTRLKEQADEVVHICISAEFSCCYQNACLAAAQVEGVYVVDSRNLSTGSAHLVLDGARMAREGMGGAAIAEELTKEAALVEASFVVDTLDYLRRGGRCSALTHLGAKLLKIKPCIEVVNGKMDVGKKYRGSYDKCIKKYVTDRLEGREDLDLSRIFVTHSGCKPATVALVKETLLALAPFGEVIETVAGCTVSNHCGPGTLGILFKRKA